MSVEISGNVGARRNGVAGQYEIPVSINYRHDETDGNVVSTSHGVTFVGSIYGAPVVVVMDTGMQVHVDNWQQYGTTLDDEWIRRFYDGEWLTSRTFVSTVEHDEVAR